MSKVFPVTPMHEKVIIKPFPPDAVSTGGIIIPDSVQERPSKATVMAVGSGMKDRPMNLKEGDVVFHIKGAGTPIHVENEEYFIVRDVDILATLQN